MLHARLPGRLEDHFGLTRQFLIYCTPVRELQPRDITQLKRVLESAEHPIESDVAVLVSNDDSAADKLRDWAIERTEGLVVVPMTHRQIEEGLSSAEVERVFPRVIEQWIATHNLYDQRDPVTGDRFFGRGDFLRELDRRIAQSRGHVGIFGLRRIGKTSVLLELAHRLRLRPTTVPIYIDLESTMGAAHVARRIGEEIARLLAQRSNLSEAAALRQLRIPDSLDEVDERLIAHIGDSLRRVVTGGALAGHHLVLILDEAEILLPSPEAPAAHAIDLFRVLRGVSQETGRLSLVLAGVNATPSESPALAGDDNPLFGLLSVEYLGPLGAEECNEMIRRVGRKMQVRWESPALSLVTQAVGAHPLLARLAASDIVGSSSARPLRPTLEMAHRVLDSFPEHRNSIFQQMVHSLEKYYLDELEFLRILASGDIPFASELADDNPSLLNHLVGYGVVDPQTLTIAIPVFERWLRR